MQMTRRQSLFGILGAVAALVVSPIVSVAKAAGWRERSRGCLYVGDWCLRYSQRVTSNGSLYKGEWPVVSVTHNGFLWAMFSTDHFDISLFHGLAGAGDARDKLADLIAKVMWWDKDTIMGEHSLPRKNYFRHMYQTDPLARQILDALTAHDADFKYLCEAEEGYRFKVMRMIRRRRPDYASDKCGPWEMEERATSLANYYSDMPREQQEQAMLAFEHQCHPTLNCLVRSKLRQRFHNRAVARVNHAIALDYVVPFRVL